MKLRVESMRRVNVGVNEVRNELLLTPVNGDKSKQLHTNGLLLECTDDRLMPHCEVGAIFELTLEPSKLDPEPIQEPETTPQVADEATRETVPASDAANS